MSEVDEYGLQVPHKSWTERSADYFAPDADDAWYEELGKAAAFTATVPATHVMDSLPFPILGELAHGDEVNRYQQQRAQAEANAEAQEAQKWYAPEQPTDPDGPMCPADDYAPTYEWMTD